MSHDLPTGTPFSPVRIMELQLEDRLTDILPATSPEGELYGKARILIKLHGHPVGLTEVALSGGRMTCALLARQLWDALGAEINAHLRDDGLPPLMTWPVEGLRGDGEAACQRRRAAILAAAPFMSVVVCTRDRPSRIARLLDGLLAQRYPAFEVLIVDNAPSSAATREVVEERAAGEPRLRYVLEPAPGLSNARNKGLRQARAEFIAMTDDDVQPDPDWLAALAEGLLQDGRVACVTGSAPPLRLDTPSQVLFEQYGGFERGFRPRLYDMDRHRPEGDVLYPYSAGVFGGGLNMAFRRSALAAVGGFDPALGAGSPAMGGEDLAMYTELLLRGYQIAYWPDALVYHDHRADGKALERQLQGYGMGFAAYITSMMLRDPRRLFSLLRRMPLGVWRILRPASSDKNPTKASLPPELLNLERRSMLAGPGAYLRGRRHLDLASRHAR